jgi:hypothetical protein
MQGAKSLFNWGFWDGLRDQQLGIFAPFLEQSQEGGARDRFYTAGYWAGRYWLNLGETSSEAAWKEHAPLEEASWNENPISDTDGANGSE